MTGAGHLDIESVRVKLAEIRSVTDLPVCVGFGIKDAESAKQISQLADGAVVGSAIVDRIAKAENNQAALTAVKNFTAEIRQAIDN